MSSGINLISSFGNIAMDAAKLSNPSSNPNSTSRLVPSQSMPSFFDFDIREEDIWGDDLSPYIEADSISFIPQVHISASNGISKQRHVISGLSALLHPSYNSNSYNNNISVSVGRGAASESFSPVHISSGNMIRELKTTGSHIVARPVTTNNTITIINSPNHSTTAKTTPCRGARSAPIKAPVWSKLSTIYDQLESPVEDDEKLPPHEIIARQHAGSQISASVMEGAGRTLKGRDMSKVRDAVWQQTGFEG